MDLLLLLIAAAEKQPSETKALPVKDACARGVVGSSKNKKPVSNFFMLIPTHALVHINVPSLLHNLLYLSL